ncbi:MAG TPA: 4-hydroxythreonine-4-phosphate dehydrogenase PdxA [Elainellaceae cyanobacterium]|jgi:4-hydroxythreonine-4-phosphate dehydrogenase
MPTQSVVCPKIAIALGDPAGIGSEVVLKALGNLTTPLNCEITLFGNQGVLNQTFDHLMMKSRDSSTSISSELARPDTLNLHEIALPAALSDAINVGIGNAASGEASFRFLDTAIAQTLAGEFHAIVTAPIAKSAWKAAGHHYPGQTELLAEKAGIKRFGMLFVARSPHTDWQLRTLLATTHIPLRQVADTLSPDLLTLKLDLLVDSLQHDFGIKQPRIAIAGLNPHSGEQGQLGTEEGDWLNQWIQTMGDRHPAIHLDGPIPPDTLWVRPGQAWYGIDPSATHDAYLALYHDQGLIPVKLMAFDRAVNTTIGLPFIRTSPDHGTAFDIAGRGIADATSFRAALDLAVELAHQRIARVSVPV